MKHRISRPEKKTMEKFSQLAMEEKPFHLAYCAVFLLFLCAFAFPTSYPFYAASDYYASATHTYGYTDVLFPSIGASNTIQAYGNCSAAHGNVTAAYQYSASDFLNVSSTAWCPLSGQPFVNYNEGVHLIKAWNSGSPSTDSYAIITRDAGFPNYDGFTSASAFNFSAFNYPVSLVFLKQNAYNDNSMGIGYLGGAGDGSAAGIWLGRIRYLGTSNNVTYIDSSGTILATENNVTGWHEYKLLVNTTGNYVWFYRDGVLKAQGATSANVSMNYEVLYEAQDTDTNVNDNCDYVGTVDQSLTPQLSYAMAMNALLADPSITYSSIETGSWTVEGDTCTSHQTITFSSSETGSNVTIRMNTSNIPTGNLLFSTSTSSLNLTFPANGTWTTIANNSINYSLGTDSTASTCWKNISGTVASIGTNLTGNGTFYTDSMAQGKNRNVSLTCQIASTNYSSSILLNYDGTNPAITIATPANGQDFGENTTFPLNFTVSDNVGTMNTSAVLSSLYSSNSSIANNTNFYYSAVENLSVGSNTLTINATDEAGNKNSTSLTLYRYNATIGTPAFNFSFVPVLGNQTVQANLILTGGAAFSAANATLTYSNGTTQLLALSLASGTNTNGNWQAGFETLNISGVVNCTVTGYTNASSGYSEASSLATFSVDGVVPAIESFTASSYDFVAPKNVTFTARISDNNMTGNASLYIDGSLFGVMAANGTLAKNNTYNLAVQLNASGVRSAYVKAFDNASNSAQSSNISLNASNYTVSVLSRDMVDLESNITIGTNFTQNFTINQTISLAFIGNASTPFNYTYTIPDINTSDYWTNATVWANGTGAVIVELTPANNATVSFMETHVVRNISITSTGDATISYINISTNGAFNATSQFFRACWVMGSSWDPTTNHVQLQTDRAGWKDIGDLNLQQGENYSLYQLYDFRTSNTTTNKDTVCVKLDLVQPHSLKATIVAGAEDTGTVTPVSPGGGGGSPPAQAQNTTVIIQSSTAPAKVDWLRLPLFKDIDGFFAGRTFNLPNYWIIITPLVVALVAILNRMATPKTSRVVGGVVILLLFSWVTGAIYYSMRVI